MYALRKLATLLTGLLLLSIQPGCGSEQAVLHPVSDPVSILQQEQHNFSGVRLLSAPPRILQEASLEQALADARNLATPPGVDEALFSELRAAFVDSLAGLAGKNASALPGGQENRIDDLELVAQGSGALLNWSYRNVGDYDLNGEVNISDITPLGIHFGRSTQSPDWATARKADGDGNGEVNISDVTPIGQHFFASVLGYNIYGRNSGSGPYTLVGSVALESGKGVPLRFSVPLASVDYETYMVAPYDSTGEDAPQQDLPNPLARLLDPQLVSLTTVTADRVVLAGELGDIQVGDVIVSGEGAGLLRKVEGITPLPGGAELTTSQATLEQLFDYVRMDTALELPFEAMTEFVPAMEGVELTRIDPPAGASGLHEASASPSTGWINLKLTRKLHENLSVSGEISFNSGLDLELDIGTGWSDMGTIHRFKTAAWVDGKAEGTIKAFKEFKLNESRQQIGTIRFSPIIVLVGLFPVVVLPEFEIWLRFTATGEVAIETSSSGWVEMELGMIYTADGGWSPIGKCDYGFGDDDMLSVLGKVKGEFGLFSPELDLAIYGVLGPYLTFDIPYVDLEAVIGYGNPPFVEINSWFGVKASAGAEVEVLGESLERWNAGEIVNLRRRVFTLHDDLPGMAMLQGAVVSSFSDILPRIDVNTGEPYYSAQMKHPLDNARLDFLQGGDWVATTWTSEIVDLGAFAKVLPIGSYEVKCSKNGYFPLSLESFAVTGPPTDQLELELDPEWDDETIMVEITSHASGEEVSEPYVLLEGQFTFGSAAPEQFQIFFEDVEGNVLNSGHYQDNYALQNGADNQLPEGAFAFPVFLGPGLTNLKFVASRTVLDSYGEHSDPILTSTQHEAFILNSVREPAALLVQLSWWEDAVEPRSHVPQLPGLPNEDFRLVVREPGQALIAGQGPPDGRGHIRSVPGMWHWYYYLPASEAVAGDTYFVRTLFHDSVLRTGTPGDFDLVGRMSVKVNSEVYSGLGGSSGATSRYPKAILPIDPDAIGLEWEDYSYTIPLSP